ncbi:MAG: hypothetical protein CMG24_01170 [Candidatus Marinimicrobia bacterium]|nr:hypothetical protein [Candidatus Neomarinimicrobiota bacterium]
MKIDNKKSFLIFTAILITSLILINLISRNIFHRFDLTDTKMYSLSESSQSIIKKIDDLMTIKVYFSNDLPGDYANNKRYLQDILEEYAAYSKGKLRFEFTDPSSSEDMQLNAQKAGIQPVQLQVIENDKVEVRSVYMGLAILYEDKREIIPIIQTTAGLEYDITIKIKKLINVDKQMIAIASTLNQNVENQTISQILSQRYLLQNITLDQPIDPAVSVVLVNGFRDSLSVDEYSNLKKYIDNGGNVLIGQNRIFVDISTQQATPINSNIFSLLKEYGVDIQENLVVDKSCGQVNVQQNMGIFRMAVPMDYPFLPIIRTFNYNEIIVNGIEQYQLLFSSEIILDTLIEKNINLVPLFSTSDRSSSITEFYNLDPDPKNNPIFSQLTDPGKIVSARSEIKSPNTGLTNNIIVVSDSEFISDSGAGKSPENHIFILNAVDYLMGDSELIALRSREITTRPLKELDNNTKSKWKWMNMLLPSIFIISFGILRFRKENKRSDYLEELYG